MLHSAHLPTHLLPSSSALSLRPQTPRGIQDRLWGFRSVFTIIFLYSFALQNFRRSHVWLLIPLRTAFLTHFCVLSFVVFLLLYRLNSFACTWKLPFCRRRPWPGSGTHLNLLRRSYDCAASRLCLFQEDCLPPSLVYSQIRISAERSSMRKITSAYGTHI